MKNVLILGAKGMLGGALQQIYPKAVAWDREDIDVTQFKDLKFKIEKLDPKPEAIINCVAFNDVDGAESKPEIAYKLNSEVPGELAKICSELNIPLVSFTSQLVFSGTKGDYVEGDIPDPVSMYGKSKAQGEQEIVKNCSEYYIIRTSVLFGPKGESELSKKSFFEIMLDLSQRSATIKAVADEVSCATNVKDLAENISNLLEKRLPAGIYHITNSGEASWYDLAKELFAITGTTVELVPVPSSEFPRPAFRPHRAILKNTKLPPLRSWQEALREFIEMSKM